MYLPILAQISSFVAMACAIASYFVKKKKLFLVAQSLAIILFALSSFFSVVLLPIFTFSIAFIRMIVYYAFEKKDKPVSFWIKTFFAILNVVAYFVLNAISGTLFNPIEIILLVASVIYTYCFGIRNLQLLRLFFIVPTVLCIIYYALVPISLFFLVSYSFELCANLVSFVLYSGRIKSFERKKQNKQILK